MGRKQVLDTDLLLEDYFSESAMIGISCQEPAFKLCWALNQHFDTCFARKPELEICMQGRRKNKLHYFGIYQHKSPFNGPKHVLYELKSEEMCLLPEIKRVDFLWLIHGSSSEQQAAEFSDFLRRIPGIQMATLIRPEQLKNLSNLIV